MFVGIGEQLAGIISLSETGRKSGESIIHEAFVVPGTIVRCYLDVLISVTRVAERENISAAQLQPILDAIGAAGTPPAEIVGRLRAFVEAARARAIEPVPSSNEGADIDAAIGAARDKLRDLDAAGARNLLQAKLDEGEQDRRRRRLLLLRERAAIERLAFDHEAAKATLAEITQLDPDDVWSWIDLGDLWVTTGPLAAALHGFGKAEAAARRHGEERDLSASHDRIGDVKVALNDLPGALAAYTDAMAIRKRLVAQDPANRKWQRDLSISHDMIGDVKKKQGDLPGALAAYTSGMVIAERLAAGDPTNNQCPRDLSIGHAKIGDVKMAQGDLAGALVAYTGTMAIAEPLVASDRANSEWQRDLSVGYDRIGHVKLAQSDLPGALTAYTDAMAIAEQLAARDPANSQWQCDLSVGHLKIGDVKVAQGDLPGALAAYTDAIAIAEQLVARDPANSEWQGDLSVSHEKIGDTRILQSDLPGALMAYSAAMTIRERLAARDPTNSEWQRDLIDICVAVAGVAPDRARGSLTRALDIARNLAGSGELVPSDAWIPDDLERRLATLPEDGTFTEPPVWRAKRRGMPPPALT